MTRPDLDARQLLKVGTIKISSFITVFLFSSFFGFITFFCFSFFCHLATMNWQWILFTAKILCRNNNNNQHTYIQSKLLNLEALSTVHWPELSSDELKQCNIDNILGKKDLLELTNGLSSNETARTECKYFFLQIRKYFLIFFRFSFNLCFLLFIRWLTDSITICYRIW